MKIELTVQLELPLEAEKYSDAEMWQMLFDHIQNRLTINYLQAAGHALVDKRFSSEEARTMTVQTYNTWADIIAYSTWNYKKVS